MFVSCFFHGLSWLFMVYHSSSSCSLFFDGPQNGDMSGGTFIGWKPQLGAGSGNSGGEHDIFRAPPEIATGWRTVHLVNSYTGMVYGKYNYIVFMGETVNQQTSLRGLVCYAFFHMDMMQIDEIWRGTSRSSLFSWPSHVRLRLLSSVNGSTG